MVGVARWETLSFGPSVAYCFEGNVADMGESAFESKAMAGARSPSSPRPTGPGASSSGGGVGVRGGTGRGILEAISVR